MAQIAFFVDRLLARAYRERLEASISVSEEEIGQYFASYRARYRHPPRYEIEHLVYKDRAAAEQAREELRDGAAWQELMAAGRRSQTLVFGEHEELDEPLILEEIASALHELEPGAMAAVLETAYGFHVVRLLSMLPARDPSLAEVRGRIVTALRRDKAARLLEEKLARLKEKRAVRVHLDALTASR